jgi:hypothetical protein
LFRLEDLIKGLGLEIPLKAEQHVNDAHLCLHAIPESAIVDTKGPLEVQLGISLSFFFILFFPVEEFQAVKLKI